MWTLNMYYNHTIISIKILFEIKCDPSLLVYFVKLINLHYLKLSKLISTLKTNAHDFSIEKNI